MKKLLSLPSNAADSFHELTGFSDDEWFSCSDPKEKQLGSGGGSAWLLQQAHAASGDTKELKDWLSSERRLILHAGGQSRRLPSYAPTGKSLIPIPVFRWERGQRLSQNLLSLQMPLYERIMKQAPDCFHTLIASGDVYIRQAGVGDRTMLDVGKIPEADVVCYGLWLPSETATKHGVFVCDRNSPRELKYMLQKPSLQTLGDLQKDHYFLTDIGLWLLSDRAVEVLMRRSSNDGTMPTPASNADDFKTYDLYSGFGLSLGTAPAIEDEEINGLSVAILPLPEGRFYHFGTSHDLINSTLAVQNLVDDQREVLHHSVKPHPSIFIQNARVYGKLDENNHSLWIENSCIGERWTLSHNHVITGVPENNWEITLQEKQCVDIIPIGDKSFVVRPYGFDDPFRGDISKDTLFLGQPFRKWVVDRLPVPYPIEGAEDLQNARIFPVVDNESDMGLVLRWMLNEPQQAGGRLLWMSSRRLSANDIAHEINLERLEKQRTGFRKINWTTLANNHRYSVFYQIDLENAAREFTKYGIPEPRPISNDESLTVKIQDAMFRSELRRLKGEDGSEKERRAFEYLKEGILQSDFTGTTEPHLSVLPDQIVWGRCPVRIDLAGGWTDTPPFCLMEGGTVVNMAVELNGQQPLQVFIRPSQDFHITLRSIDLGASEKVMTYEQLINFQQVGSPFAIPKAALVLAGFGPGDINARFRTLTDLLKDFGGGMEITLLSAIPAGSGMGTSSLLATTVLGALNDFCGLGWDKSTIGRKTLSLEQLLTTGGGWQDQYGGISGGVKLLRSGRGFEQIPTVSWLPTDIFTNPEYSHCHLLYYTGITRTAKTILKEIVRKMFLNQGEELVLLREMKEHALDMSNLLQRQDMEGVGRLLRKTWRQNTLIDSGTNPPDIEALTRRVDDWCLGYKLPGAGGGGFLYMMAKDAMAAARIREELINRPINPNARFVDMTISKQGMQVSRS